MEGMQEIVKQHPFFAGLDDAVCAIIGGCAKNVRFSAGDYLFRQGEPADEFYLIRHGRVALEISAPGVGAIAFETLGEGQILGASWLVPPYRWNHDAKALELTRAIAMDAACLRRKCEADHDLGYEMMKRFAPILAASLHAMQLQILDVYGARN